MPEPQRAERVSGFAGSYDRERFLGQIERMRLLTMRAVAKACGRPSDRIEDELRAFPAGPPSVRERRLATRLGLDDDALGFLWFAVALATDPLLAPHAVALGGNDAKRGATLSLYAAVLAAPTARARSLALALGEAHPLLRHALLEPAAGDTDGTFTPFRAPRRVAGYLAGDDAAGDTLGGVGARVALPAAVVGDPDTDAAERRIRRLLEAGEPAVVVVEGPDGVGRRTLVARAARGLREVVALDVRRAASLAALEAGLAALRREVALTDAVPILVGMEWLSTGPDGAARDQATQRFVDDCATVVLAGEGGFRMETAQPVVRIALSVPAAPVRRALWRAAAGETAAADALDAVAMRYRLGAGGIAAAARAARAAGGDFGEGVRATIGQRLGDLATRLEVKQTWDDLVLPDDVRGELDLVRARAQHAYRVLATWGLGSRASGGGGLAVLLSGAPGTGKTMIAGLLARELDLELYQVDLSRVVSKWLGETEKNLSRLFSAADCGHALLLFDEADGLFARRTEVRGSNDRYANLEVNHLLQRVDAFGGVAVLTTNLEASLDPALRRRLAAHIQIPKPERGEREALWRRLLAGRAPVADDVDCARLAVDYPDVTGGDIRNAVLTAAYLAAAEGSTITARHVARAAEREYRSMRRVCAPTRGARS